jgi:hypothetical protein
MANACRKSRLFPKGISDLVSRISSILLLRILPAVLHWHPVGDRADFFKYLLGIDLISEAERKLGSAHFVNPSKRSSHQSDVK